MSSNPRAEPYDLSEGGGPGAGERAAARRWRGPAAWSLRARLVAELLALLALVSLVVGVTTELALRDFLTGQLDAQLQAAGGRSAAAAGQPPPWHHGGPGPDFLVAPGQAAGTLGAELLQGQVRQAAVLTAAGGQQTVPASAQAVLQRLPADGRPHTRSLGSLGDYRLLATRAEDGDVIVTGLPLGGLEGTLARLAVVMGAVAAGALAVSGALGVLIVRATLRPLRRVAATAARVAELPLDRGEVALSVRVPDADLDPRTEVGQVAGVLNRMLEHVAGALAARQASETRVRRFVADASHELRTPLAAIRGYAELGLRGRLLRSEVEQALARVQSESDRMTVLVQELLLLARLDYGRAPLREPVDLTRLTAEAVADARVAGPRHRWRLELTAEPVTVSGDGAELQQVLANLLSNARVHTPAGTTVTARLASVEGGGAVLTVLDDGPGIPPEVLPLVFGRFVRGDRSRARTAGSTGLGLSIVEAVVEAHGGSVEVSSRPGRTAFTVSLPGTVAESLPNGRL
jgi:two-component system, OmpR family, sensor kinase